MKKIVLTVLIVGILGAAGFLVYRNLSPKAEGPIVVSGNIELTQVDIAFKTTGRLTELNVDEGDPVTKGEVIARLDRDQLEQQRAKEMASLASADAALAEAGSSLRFQQVSTEADLEVRQAEINSAQSHLLELKNGSRPQEIAEARSAVAAAQAEYDHARQDWDRAQVLYSNDDISTSQRDESRHRYDATSANLQQVKQRQALVEAGPRSESIESADAEVRRARARLKMGEADKIETERREQEIALRKADIARSRAQIALIDSQISDTTALSPSEAL